MPTPDASRYCKISKELHGDLSLCLNELNEIAPRFLKMATARVIDKLAELNNGNQPIDLGIANRELRLATKLVEAIELASEILSGKVISNQVDKRPGEIGISELVTSLRFFAQDPNLESFASTVITESGESRDRSLGALFRKHARELSQLSMDNSLEAITLPRPPTVSDSDFR